MSPEMTQELRDAFQSFDANTRGPLEVARKIILETASELDQIDQMDESLKWGQPSYAPTPKTGTPIRLGVTKSGEPTLFVHCQTTLVSDLEADNAHGLQTIDNRAVVLPKTDLNAHQGLRNFVKAALTYHL